MKKEFPKSSYVVQDLMLRLDQPPHSISIGVPKENHAEEKRLALTPEVVKMLVDCGIRVLVEKDAGKTINYSDRFYSEAGAEIVDRDAEVYIADIIVKIGMPRYEEVEMMKSRSTIFSFLQMNNFSKATLDLMAHKRINALAYDFISDHTGTFPFVMTISEIEGATAIMLASEMLGNAHGGKGMLLGGIPGVPPTEIIIVGAGVAGTIAARAALALGAQVKIFDNDINKLREIQHALGRTLFTSTFHPNVMLNNFRSADVIIGAMQYVNKTSRYIISSELIQEMKPGALIIDLRMNQGGCFETTVEACLPDQPTLFEKFGVLHCCEPNLSSRVARTSSMAVSNILFNMFTNMLNTGGISNFAQIDRGFSGGFYMYSGKMVNSYLASHFNMPFNEIGLFLAGF